MSLEYFSDSLSRHKSGIFLTAQSSEFSYSADGHEACFAVEDSSFWFQHRNDCISALVNRFPPSAPILDVGGGNGYVAERLIRDGHRVVLLEPGITGALNALRSRGIKDVICGTLEGAAFKPHRFGGISMFDVIEHISSDSAAVLAAHELLQPGGKLYLTVPCHVWLWSDADVDAGHFRRYTRSSIEALLSPRFKIDYLSYFFRPLLIPQLLFRALPYRLGFSIKSLGISTENEHGTENGMATRIMRIALRKEAARIANGESLALGSSCLVVASAR